MNNSMMEKLFLNAEEVAQSLGVSKAHAYKSVRQLNEELKSKGFITVSGRISTKYFEERVYGLDQKSV